MRNLKRMAAIAVTVAMTFSMMACGSNATDSSPAAENTEAESTSESETAESTAESETAGNASENETSGGSETSGDVVTLDVFYTSSRPMNEATDLTRQYIRDTLGVDINLIQGDGANFDQQLALYVSSGDMPDIVLCDYSVWIDYAQSGAWADISPYLGDEYTDLMNFVGDDWSYVTMDDKVYGIPNELKVPSSHVTYVRQDWLDKLNLEIPKTLDEFTEVMRQFTFNDPDGDGQDNTYGLSAAGYTYLSFLMGAFGASTERDYFLNEDGTITDNAISDEYKAALTYLRDIYAEGLIDPELFTCTYEQAMAKWGRNEMGMLSAWWSHGYNAYSRFDFGTLQPDAVVTPILPPVGEDGKSGNLHSAPFSQVVGISHLCTEEELAAAIKYMNFQASDYGFRVLQYGIEDEFFEWDEETNQTTWYWGFNDNKSKSGKYETTDMEVYKILFHEDLNAQTFKLAGTYEYDLLAASSDMRYTEPYREDLFCMFLTDEYVEYHAELDNYFTQNMLAFILGDKDIDAEWDSYVNEYLNMGGEIERQAQLAAYNEQFGTSYTFAN